MNRYQLERRPKDTTGLMELFDPQLYLRNLDKNNCLKTCVRLATYPWFEWYECPQYDSDNMRIREWESEIQEMIEWPTPMTSDPQVMRSLVQQCFEYQINACRVDRLITPVPLAENPDDQFTVQLEWIDAALAIRNEYRQPILATVPLLDELLAHEKPSSNTYLQTILDNLTTMEGIDGFYIVVMRAREASSTRMMTKNVVHSLLTMCFVLGHLYSKEVIVNYVDDLGLVCSAVGASAFGTGYTNKMRRMNQSDFEDRDGGKRYPYFYSATMFADFLPQDDLERIQSVNLLWWFSGDETEDSAPLLRALATGRTAKDVPNWRQSNQNVAASSAHRVNLIRRRAEQIRNSSASISARARMMLQWLQQAECYAAYLNARLGDPLDEDLRHLGVWRAALEELIAENDL